MGSFLLEGPQLNPKVKSYLDDNEKKIKRGFVEIQNETRLFMAAVGQGCAMGYWEDPAGFT